MNSQTLSADAPVAARPAETSSNDRFASGLNGDRRTRSASRHGSTSDAGTQIATLTAREREVCRLVAEGMTNKQVGYRLFVSPITVRHHLTSIFRKLSVQNRFELIVLSYRHELAVRSADSRPARPDAR